MRKYQKMIANVPFVSRALKIQATSYFNVWKRQILEPGSKTLTGCKTHSFKYGYLDVRQRIIMNADFADSQLTQRVSKLFSILTKKESNGKIAKKATDNRYWFTLRSGWRQACFVEAVNLFASMFIYLFNFFSCLLLYMHAAPLVYGSILCTCWDKF